jgi:RNA polymerase sigma factor for flagellar operon FliA
MYTATGTIDKEQCISQLAPLVKRIAHHLLARLPACVQVDDLIQAGMIGLLDAVNRYEGSMGAQFEAYAAQRIRGAMLDELRQADWVPRGLRKKMRRIEAAVAALEQRLGRAPTEQQLAEELGMSLAEYQQTLFDARGAQLVYLEDFEKNDEDDTFLERYASDFKNDPLQELLNEDLRSALVRAIDELPEREKLVMGMYYEEGLNLKEIGAVLGVSESRVCQLHTQAIARLRSRLRKL